MYESVRAQLMRAKGVAGLSDGDIVPNQWEHEAIQREQQLYNEGTNQHDREHAWEQAYEEGGER